MAMHIDKETEELAAQIASITGETEADAVREALRERRDRLGEHRERAELRADDAGNPRRNLQKWLETEIWPLIPEEDRGKPPMTKAELAEALGYGPEES